MRYVIIYKDILEMGQVLLKKIVLCWHKRK